MKLSVFEFQDIHLQGFSLERLNVLRCSANAAIKSTADIEVSDVQSCFGKLASRFDDTQECDLETVESILPSIHS